MHSNKNQKKFWNFMTMCSQNKDGETPLPTKIEFSIAVESHATANDLSLIESCIVVAELNDIEHADIPKFIYQALKDKLQVEALANRTIRDDSQNSTLALFDI